MFDKLRSHLTYANVVASIALFVALGGGAYAAIGGAIPDRSGVFHACYSKKTGALRVVKASTKCKKKKEAAIKWSQTGPAGRNGANGAPGTPADTSTIFTRSQSDSRYLQLGAQATDSALLGGQPPAAFMVNGASDTGSAAYGLGGMTAVARTLNISVGPGARHVLIVATGDIWSSPTFTCDDLVGLFWQGSRQDATLRRVVVPSNGALSGSESFATSAMPLLPAGPQTIQLLAQSPTPMGCLGPENSTLEAVVLGS